MARIFSSSHTIVTDTNIYATGDFLGTAILTINNASRIDGTMLESIVLTDLTKQSLAIDFLFWSTACTNTTFTNNGVLDIHDTDLLTFLGGASIVAGDYFALNDNSVAAKRDIKLPMNPASSSTGIYCTPVARATPTYDANALKVTFTFVRE